MLNILEIKFKILIKKHNNNKKTNKTTTKNITKMYCVRVSISLYL